jgi:hypothetical protein
MQLICDWPFLIIQISTHVHQMKKTYETETAQSNRKYEYETKKRINSP